MYLQVLNLKPQAYQPYDFSLTRSCSKSMCGVNQLVVFEYPVRGVPKGKKNSTIFGRAFVYSSFRVQLLQNFGRSSNPKTRQDLVEFSRTRPLRVVWNIRKTRVCLFDLIRIISTVDQIEALLLHQYGRQLPYQRSRRIRNRRRLI